MTEHRILQLDESVIKRIAAGEVINFPSNVAKELLENSIDAGSKRISTELQNGGYSLIKISDNGCGINAADMPLACQRHATSKIQSFNDLRNVTTFGFRGEALFSMSCVSHLSILSKTEESSFGYSGNFQDGNLIGELSTVPITIGTTVTISDLFYNKPTKLRTSPDSATQNRKILQIVQRYAIAYPEISFSVICDGKEKMMTHGSSSHYDVISLLYGIDARSATFVLTGDIAKNTTVEMYLGSPSAKKQLKESAVFVNGRLVQCDHIKRAINAVYGSFLMRGEKPFAFVLLRMPPDKVDVNVHPTKKDVIFTNEQSLIDNICDIILAELKNQSKTRNFSEKTEKKKDKKNDDERLSSFVSSKEIKRKTLDEKYEDLVEDDEKITVNNPIQEKFNQIIGSNRSVQNKSDKNQNEDELNEEDSFNTSNKVIQNKSDMNHEEDSNELNQNQENSFNASNKVVQNKGDKNQNDELNEEGSFNTSNRDVQNKSDKNLHEEEEEEKDSIVEDDEESPKAKIDIDRENKGKYELSPVSINEENLTDITPASSSSDTSDTENPRKRARRNPYMKLSSDFQNLQQIDDLPKSDNLTKRDSDQENSEIPKSNIPSSLFNKSEVTEKPKPRERSSIFDELKFTPKSMARGDPNLQTLEQVLNMSAAKEMKRDPTKTKREMNLVTASSLLSDEKKNSFEPLITLFRAHSFVGLIGLKYGLIQADETLYAVHLFQVFRVLFYQSCLSRIGNFGKIVFDKPLDVKILADSVEGSDSLRVKNILIEHREMLSDLFNIVINDMGCLEEMPMIVANYEPSFSFLPIFLVRLAETEWDGELECISYICDELSMLYSPCEEESNDTKNIEKMKKSIRDVLFPELKTAIFFPPAALISNLSVIRVRSLHEMYKIFERN
ncbi:DNA mismatch repair protein, putative [Trichomonas vaginalis G3]|uniref:DNA mismatch repair protein, putative n=4 Tax=Trichomonas vaginalis TaxID=5722 RepID=A2EGR5_TRIV3|nr:DNA mismatch repair protein, MLH1-like [Trichomonas vaginalis G3]ABC61974.1 MLH1-like protein 1 [Trichomonas vaginalis]EAY08153.1 DNA mismatch repair protein, putative [Trichomonas vaginalis G3]KAI5548715.1 DNA mismatch repair protein, MLH1-like [Trichomonas vaginalis G3]|eukprot:XP_001320376.1 DNA mismatch repair protein [Trichomonas vaginalis G3]